MVRDEIIELIKEEFALNWEKPSCDTEVLGEYRSYGDEYFNRQHWTEIDLKGVLSDPKVLVELQTEWFIYYWPSILIEGLTSLSWRPFVHSSGHPDIEWIDLDWIRYFRKSDAFHNLPSPTAPSVNKRQLSALLFGFSYLASIYVLFNDASATQGSIDSCSPCLLPSSDQTKLQEPSIKCHLIEYEKVTEDIFSFLRLATRSGLVS